MNPFFTMILLAALAVGGFAVGMMLGSRNRRLPRKDRVELDQHRNFLYDLSNRASEHATLGDDFAVIVLGMINDHRKELPR